MNEDGRAWRATRRGSEEVAVCPCGSSWFTLRGAATTEHLPNGAVSVDGHGNVIAYAGDLHCIECGARWEAGAMILRSVE